MQFGLNSDISVIVFDNWIQSNHQIPRFRLKTFRLKNIKGVPKACDFRDLFMLERDLCCS